MSRIHIPNGSWMKYRKGGRYVWGQKRSDKPTTWTTTPPPAGTKVYVVAWANGQSILMASKVETIK